MSQIDHHANINFSNKYLHKTFGLFDTMIIELCWNNKLLNDHLIGLSLSSIETAEIVLVYFMIYVCKHGAQNSVINVPILNP